MWRSNKVGPSSEGLQFILMTYRSHIQPLLPSTYYESDSGWGCMLRVLQMFIANLLHRRLGQPFHEVVKLFHDNQFVPFGIQLVTAAGHRLFKKKNYQWFNPSEAGFIIQDLLNKYLETHRVSIANDNCIFLDQIEKDRQNCILLVMCRIGLDQPQKQYIQLVARLSSSKYFVGMLGGKPKLAHFFIEHSELQGKFRYLDPHKTHKAFGKEESVMNHLDQFRGKLHEVNDSDIDPSMCLSFQFKTQQLQQFWSYLEKLKLELKDRFFLYIDKMTPQISGNDLIEIIDDDM